MSAKIRLIGCGLALLLAGCFWEDDDDRYPDLKDEDVIGCWSQINPSTFGCLEYCFDSAGLFYHKFVASMDSTSFGESFGTYMLKGSAIGMSHRLASSRNPAKKDSLSWFEHYARIRDTLVLLGNGGRSLTDIRYRRADMATECGGPWKIFPKPSDWRLP